MPVVGCPKCKKKFKLSEEMLGKTVRCSVCQTKFKTAASAKRRKGDSGKGAGEKTVGGKRRKKKPAVGGDEPTGASTAALKDLGLSGKLNPQLDLFSQPIPDKRAPNPLGNHALEDPGFGSAEIDDDEEEDDDVEVNDDMKQLLANPALKSLAKAKGARKPSRTMKKPSDFKEIRLLGYFVISLGALAIVCYLTSAVFDVINIFQGDNPAPAVAATEIPATDAEISDAENPVDEAFPTGLVIWLVGIGFSTLSFFVSLFYWYMANANTTAMGAKGQTYTPLWMVLSWFIPLANLLWPMQGIAETYKASKRPAGKKWQKLEASLWQAPVWTIAMIAAFACSLASWRIASGGVTTFTSQLLGGLAPTLLAALAVFCIISMVMKVTTAQYDNFEK